MSIAHAASTVANAARAVASAFAFTRYGQQAADGDAAYISAADFADNAVVSNAARGHIWVEMTATNCFIRVAETHEDSASVNQWYDTTGANQGNQGTYLSASSDLYELGEQPDSINIYTVSTTNTAGAPTFSAIGSYTDDNQTTFFAPTQDVKYGKYVNSETIAGPGFDSDLEQGEVRMKFTFRKAGYDDVEVEFIIESRSLSTSEL